MTRWQPDARGRLMEAAVALFQARGYDATTVADIAAEAGLTERTFFRYFTDKREVLFYGAPRLQQHLVDTLAAQPATSSPMAAIAATILSAASVMPARREAARTRNAIIMAHAELRERELLKLAALSTALATGLRARGVAEPHASLAAESGVAVFKVAFERWITAPKSTDFAPHITATFAELQIVVTDAPARARHARPAR